MEFNLISSVILVFMLSLFRSSSTIGFAFSPCPCMALSWLTCLNIDWKHALEMGRNRGEKSFFPTSAWWTSFSPDKASFLSRISASAIDAAPATITSPEIERRMAHSITHIPALPLVLPLGAMTRLFYHLYIPSGPPDIHSLCLGWPVPIFAWFAILPSP